MTETHTGVAATAERQELAVVRLPQLGESVVEGTVLQWLVKEGATITHDEPLMEIETEKVVAEIPSPFEGTVHSFAVEIGQTVPVGTPLMYITPPGGAGHVAPEETHGSVVTQMTQDPETDTLTAGMTQATDSPTPPVTHITAPPSTSGAHTNDDTAGYVEAPDAAVHYSPAVRKLAKEFNLDPATVTGTGAGGRVTREDMMRAHAASNAREKSTAPTELPPLGAVTPAIVPAPAASTPGVPPAPAAHTNAAPHAAPGTPDLIPMTTMRRRTAEALVRAAQTIPQAATWAEADVTDLVRRRAREKEAFRAREGVSLTYLPFFIQAALAAIREYPVISSQWTDDGILLKRNVGMGIAVSTDNGLVVPVIHNAGNYSITGLAHTLDEKIHRARTGKLTLDDIGGGTVTLTNPGSFGSLRTFALVRPNEAAMYSVDAIVEKPVVRDGGIAIRSIVTIGLSFDHRIFDGREAVLFLNVVKAWLETQAASVPL